MLLKLERHAREQAKRGADLAQGVLLGLSSPVDHSNPSGYLRVEVTNSFPHLPALPSGADVTADKRDEELTNRASCLLLFIKFWVLRTCARTILD